MRSNSWSSTVLTTTWTWTQYTGAFLIKMTAGVRELNLHQSSALSSVQFVHRHLIWFGHQTGREQATTGGQDCSKDQLGWSVAPQTKRGDKQWLLYCDLWWASVRLLSEVCATVLPTAGPHLTALQLNQHVESAVKYWTYWWERPLKLAVRLSKHSSRREVDPSALLIILSYQTYSWLQIVGESGVKIVSKHCQVLLWVQFLHLQS